MAKRPQYAFDPKCLELAEYFYPALAGNEVLRELAEAFQRAAEDFHDSADRVAQDKR